MNVQLAANVLLITPVDANGECMLARRYILAADGTPFVKYCQIGEHLVGTHGEIVRQFLVPLSPPPESRRPVSPVVTGDAAADDDDDDGGANGGFTGALMQALGIDPSNDSAGALPMHAVARAQPRTMDDRGTDAVAASGENALVDGSAADVYATLRRRGPSGAEGDTTTYSVPVGVDTDAGATRPTFTPPGVSASTVATPVDTASEQEFRWVRIDRVELWSSFAVFRAVHAMEGGLIQAIKSGKLDASPGFDLDARVDAWSHTYSARLREREVATDLLVRTLESNRAHLHPNIRGLLDAVQATGDRLVPRVPQ